MKATHDWHRTPAGTLIRWIGSIQLAVPLLALVSVAMVWGTYIESTQSARAAKAAVYGAWWFIALMVLVCLSLIFAVVTRYPWKRRHVGFMVVHASLIALIAGGFWSLFGRVEGRIVLEQGMSADEIELDEEYLELLEHQGGQMRVVGAVKPPPAPATVTLGGISVRIADRWENTREEFDIADGGPEPYRAVELSFGSSMGAMWVGEETRNGPAQLGDLTIRLLPPGQSWEPPAAQPAAAEAPGFYFVVGDQRFPLGKEGEEAFPGWTIREAKWFTHATVSSTGLEESKSAQPGKEENPAVDVTITDGQGTTERHTCFMKFPDMVLAKTLEGTAKSGARLTASGATPAAGETIVLFGDLGALRVGYTGAEGTGQVLTQGGPLPWKVEAGKRSFTILREFGRVHEVSRFVKAPAANETRPALIVAAGPESVEPVPLAWKATLPVGPGPNLRLLRYGPRAVPLGFNVRLDEFRKMDYPGTDMAMAYESDVTVTAPGEPESKSRIFMNNPLKKGGWKVYQSGFSGTRISIFSVMKDPGLPLTYLGSIGLCVGIIITFYSRGFSWGHPGIPAPFIRKEPSDASSPSSVAKPAVEAPEPAGAGGAPAESGVGVPVGAVD